jgi:hypothetical protein
MNIKLKPVVAAVFLAGMVTQPSFAAPSDAQIEKLTAMVNNLQSEVSTLKNELRIKHSRDSWEKIATKKHGSRSHGHHSISVTADTTPTPSSSSDVSTDGSHELQRSELASLVREEREFLPFDIDVPGQAFVSTGPYVGVPIQFSGTNLLINSPSVNTDAQLLQIRKKIHEQLVAMGGEIYQEPYHSHLLLSGVVEGDLGYLRRGNAQSQSDIDVSNVALDLFFIGPSNWTLGFVEFMYDGTTPKNSPYTSDSEYRVSNSRVFINKAFMTIGDFARTPWYGTLGQSYVPFGLYSSFMVSDTLTKILTRTKARYLEAGYMQQTPNALYGSLFIFRGDSHVGAESKINNGGFNLGYKFDAGFLKANLGTGLIANIADSGGLQIANGFNDNERIAHRVPGYDLRGVLSFGEHVDVISEWVGASTSFSPQDMGYNGRGAKPSALDTEISYSFMAFDRPSNIGLGYSRSREAMPLGIPLNRYGIALNTSIFRNTLQSIEFRRDQEYPQSVTGINAGNIPAPAENGEWDNAVTMQFDYYF